MLLVGAGCFGAAGWLATTNWIVFGAGPLSLGVLSLVQATRSTGEADCPGCGARLAQLRLSDNDGIVCGACRRFVEGRAGELWLTDEGRVADVAIFGAAMPATGRPTFPAKCPACLAPSTRTVSLRATVARGRYEQERYQYEVPACARHTDGARLLAGAPFRLAFRSYAYQRAFCEANGVTPVQLV